MLISVAPKSMWTSLVWGASWDHIDAQGLCRAGPAPPHPEVWHPGEQESWPCPLSAVSLGELIRAVPESSPWWHGCRRADGLMNSATRQAQIQAHPNIDPMSELLEYGKGPVLPIQSCRISMAKGNSRMSERNPSEGIDRTAESRGFEPDQ